MKAILACAAALLIPAAISADAPVRYPIRVRPIDARPGADGYVFQQKEFAHLSLRLDVNEYRTREELRQEHRREFPEDGYLDRLNAFSRWTADGRCVIHIMDPAVAQEPEIVGHELEHCLHGDFHPRQEAAR